MTIRFLNFDTNTATALPGFTGFQIPNGANLHAPWYSQLTQAPTAFGNYNTVDTAFNGDLSHNQIAMEHRITGAATLGQPATGYLYTEEAYAINGFLYNTSGWNQDTNDNVGRTAACWERIHGFHNGLGDMIIFNASVFVENAKPGATSYLANPAGVILAGDVFAGQAGVYLNPIEFDLHDQGFDVAGAGYVTNLTRTVNTGALGAWWVGERVQSIGTQPIDVGFSLTGPANFGIDLCFATLGTNAAAITLKADQRIYGNVTATDATGLSRFPSSVGDAYITYSSSLGAWNIIANGASILQIYGASAQVFANVPKFGYAQTPTTILGAADVQIGAAATINSRISLNMNGTTYWLPCSTTAF